MPLQLSNFLVFGIYSILLLVSCNQHLKSTWCCLIIMKAGVQSQTKISHILVAVETAFQKIGYFPVQFSTSRFIMKETIAFYKYRSKN
ncbi:hypothetical protein QQG55_32560 [Brugia pahangi]